MISELYYNNNNQIQRYGIFENVEDFDTSGANDQDTFIYNTGSFIPTSLQLNNILLVHWGGNIDTTAGNKFPILYDSTGGDASNDITTKNLFKTPYKCWIDTFSISKEDKLDHDIDIMAYKVNTPPQLDTTRRITTHTTGEKFSYSSETNKFVDPGLHANADEYIYIEISNIAPSSSLYVNIILLLSEYF